MTKHLWPTLQYFLTNQKLLPEIMKKKEQKGEEPPPKNLHLVHTYYYILKPQIANPSPCDIIHFIPTTHQWFQLHHSNLEAFSKASSQKQCSPGGQCQKAQKVQNSQASGIQLKWPNQIWFKADILRIQVDSIRKWGDKTSAKPSLVFW